MDYGIGRIVVANTFTTNKEVQTYVNMAEAYGYTYFSVIVENLHGGVNSHGVPEEGVEKQKAKLLKNIKL